MKKTEEVVQGNIVGLLSNMKTPVEIKKLGKYHVILLYIGVIFPSKLVIDVLKTELINSEDEFLTGVVNKR